MDEHDQPAIIKLDELEHTRHAHEFVGAEHADVPFSFILVHSDPASARSYIGTPTRKYFSSMMTATSAAATTMKAVIIVLQQPPVHRTRTNQFLDGPPSHKPIRPGSRTSA